MKHKLNVYFLGQFKIVLDDDIELNYESIGSQKNARLLAFLLNNHDIKLSGQEIQDVMFSDDSSNNPSNALKSLVYRLRTILKKHFGDIEIIVSGSSSYYLNPDIDIVLDIDVFDGLINNANSENGLDKKIESYNKAVSLYKGPLLPMLKDEQWVVISSTYLESTFISCTSFLLDYYLSKSDYEVVEKLSKEALVYDPLNEKINYFFVKALLKQNKKNLAKQHYLKMEKLLFEELGIQPNDELQALYDELISSQRIKEDSITNVQKNLIEEDIQGAFQCSYDTFKKIYQLEVRKAIRRGFSEYVVLLTIETADHIQKNNDLIDSIIKNTSSLLSQTIRSTLRLGDTFTKYSNQQYLILLPDCTDENAKSVVNRIINNFYKLDKYKRVIIDYKIDEIKLGRLVDNGTVLSVK